MKKIHIRACAKINLGLDVISRRSDGYHNIKTLMQSIDLYDELYFAKSNNISIKTNRDDLDCGKSNIIYKCIELMQKKTGMKHAALKVTVEKNIPIGAGLGGGSADGAAAISAFNILYELGYSKKELAEIGKEAGADIPFLLYGGCALCEGIGDIITPISERFDYTAVIVKPEINIDTKTAYTMLDRKLIHVRPDFDDILYGLKNKNLESVQKGMVNVFETYVDGFNDEVQNIKNAIYGYDPIAAAMSGSGSAVFGLFEEYKDALNAYTFLKQIYDSVYIAKFRDTSLLNMDQ